MSSGTVEPTQAEITEFVNWVADCLTRGQRLPLNLRVTFGITAELEQAMRMPDDADIT
jgi:hypothetical protein